MRRRWRSWYSRRYGKGDLEVEDFAMVREWGSRPQAAQGERVGGARERRLTAR